MLGDHGARGCCHLEFLTEKNESKEKIERREKEPHGYVECSGQRK